jgi:hypothetical protein
MKMEAMISPAYRVGVPSQGRCPVDARASEPRRGHRPLTMPRLVAAVCLLILALQPGTLQIGSVRGVPPPAVSVAAGEPAAPAGDPLDRVVTDEFGTMQRICSSGLVSVGSLTLRETWSGTSALAACTQADWAATWLATLDAVQPPSLPPRAGGTLRRAGSPRGPPA